MSKVPQSTDAAMSGTGLLHSPGLVAGALTRLRPHISRLGAGKGEQGGHRLDRWQVDRRMFSLEIRGTHTGHRKPVHSTDGAGVIIHGITATFDARLSRLCFRPDANESEGLAWLLWESPSPGPIFGPAILPSGS